MAFAINSDEPLVDTKQFYLNNGDMIIVKDGRVTTHYWVCSYTDPEETDTAPYCVLNQMATGNKIGRRPNNRMTTMDELLKSIRRSYYHLGSDIKKNDITIVGRDSYTIDIKVI